MRHTWHETGVTYATAGVSVIATQHFVAPRLPPLGAGSHQRLATTTALYFHGHYISFLRLGCGVVALVSQQNLIQLDRGS